MENRKVNPFITLHLGAGYHNPDNVNQFKKCYKDACRLGMKLLQDGESSLVAAEAVCSFLEDNPLTNAGYGSNLTIKGYVENEAAIMDCNSNTFGAVSCCKNVLNPIKLAKIVLEEQLEINEFGLVKPMVVSGDSTKEIAEKHNIKVVNNEGLCSKDARRKHEKYKGIIERDNHKNYGKRPCKSKEISSSENSEVKKEFSNESETFVSELQDTIGVICIDKYCNMSSAISSGGILLKQDGRIGHSSHYGCGCWSFKYTKHVAIASCTTGCGELLIKTNLAKEAAEYLLRETDDVINYDNFLKEKFLTSRYLQNCHNEKLCGILVVKLVVNDDSNIYIDFYIAHTSRSFCLAYFSSNMKKPHTLLSRLDKNLVGRSSLSQGFTFTL